MGHPNFKAMTYGVYSKLGQTQSWDKNSKTSVILVLSVFSPSQPVFPTAVSKDFQAHQERGQSDHSEQSCETSCEKVMKKSIPKKFKNDCCAETRQMDETTMLDIDAEMNEELVNSV